MSNFNVYRNGPFLQYYGQFPISMASGAPLVEARAKTRMGMPIRGGYVHIPERLVVGLDHGRLRYAALWMCGQNSIDAVIVSKDDIRGEQRCAICVDAAEGPTLYRFFGESGELLYIGSAEKYLVRRPGHLRQRWWSEVKAETLERYPSLLAARIAEIDAIRAENPRYNTTRRLRAVA